MSATANAEAWITVNYKGAVTFVFSDHLCACHYARLRNSVLNIEYLCCSLLGMNIAPTQVPYEGLSL
jgi:hypothetical protein